MRRGCGTGRDDSRVIDKLAWFRFNLGGIDEPVAAHPDIVICLRQIGQNITALIVGDDDF